MFHSEQLPSAIERYVKEINRVSGVLDAYLGKQKEEHGASGDGPWLVGNKLSYADLAFVPWQRIVKTVVLKEGEYNEPDFPHLTEWFGKMAARQAAKTVFAMPRPEH